MRFEVKFKDISEKLPLTFKEVVPISDGGFEKGYEAGYKQGYTDASGTHIDIPDRHGIQTIGYTLPKKLPSGTYLLTLKVESNGTDTKNNIVYAYDSKNGNVGIMFNRGVLETRPFFIGNELVRFNFYAETSSANSANDECTYSNIILENVVEGNAKNYSENTNQIKPLSELGE